MKANLTLNLGIALVLTALLLLATDGVSSLLAGSIAMHSLAEVLALYGIDLAAGGMSGRLQSLLSLPAVLPPLVLGSLLVLLGLITLRARIMKPRVRPTAPSIDTEPVLRTSASVAAGKAAEAGATSMPQPMAVRLDVKASGSPRPPSVSPAAPSPSSAPSPHVRDMEFLPAALEILMTPPSPVATSLMSVIAATLLFGLGWAYFGHLDIYAVAPGRTQFSGRSKVVQPLETGRITRIQVSNGQRVGVGEVLFQLDATEAQADWQAIGTALQSAQAEVARRRAVVETVQRGQVEAAPAAYAVDIAPEVRRREDDLQRAEIARLNSSLDSLKAQIAEKIASKARLQAGIDARANLIALMRERVGMRVELEKRGAGSRALIIESQQQLESALTTDASERGQLVEADRAAESLQIQQQVAISQFVADQRQKLVEADKLRERLEQELIKSRSKHEQTELRAPIDGTVQQLVVTAVGQVVTTGQALATIVPLGDDLEVAVMVDNKDIGFVTVGQQAVVKVEAFPFTRYGTIDAEVTQISTEAVEERDAVPLNDAADIARPRVAQNDPNSLPQNLVYPATLRLSRHSLTVDGREVPLASGMKITAEIRTGSRRAIDYILSPLREVLHGAGHER